jgi:hypothetical protein
VEVFLSDHAIERYRERVRPGLSVEDAEAELQRVLGFATFTREPPDFAAEHEGVTVGFLLLGDGIAFPVVRSESGGDFVATTCVGNWSLSEETRERRNRKAAIRRRRRKARRFKHLGHNGRPVEAADLAA